MAVVKLFNLLAISCLALVASFGPTPVAAVSVENTRVVRHNHLHHDIAAKKKRGTSTKRCKPRSTQPAPAKLTSTPKSSSSTPKSTKAPSNDGGSDSGSSNNGGSGAGKAGIAWANGDSSSIKNFKSWKSDTYYTWSPWCLKDAEKAGFHCCPMLWGHKQIDTFQQLVKPGYAQCVLGPNEPNQSGQSNMDPEEGARLWKTHIDPLKDHGYYTVSPACTSAPSGKDWMKKFLAACDGCRIDALALHWYGTDAQQFIDYVTDFYNTFKQHIWVTEFACQDFSGGKQASKEQVFQFVATVTEWMDKTPWIEKYFLFGALNDMANVNPFNQIISNNGPNKLGDLYLGL